MPNCATRPEAHRVVLGGKQAESLAEYLVKGKQIYVEGRLQTRQWDDKDGNKRYTTEIRGDRIVLLGGGGRGGRRAGPERGGEEPIPLLDLEQQAAGPEQDRLLLPVVILETERMAGVH